MPQKPVPWQPGLLPWMFLLFILGASQAVPGLQLKSRPAEDWIPRLERPGRVAELKLEEVVNRLGLKPGDNVADIGAGSGVFSRPLAKTIAPGGTLYAVDIQQGFLDYIGQWARQEKIGNIRTVLGEFDDPKLPANDLDAILFHDVLHHIENRAVYLKALGKYLKPTGRVIVIDLIRGHPNAPHKEEPELQISQDEVSGWMLDAGFRVLEKIDLFDNKFFLVFAQTR